MCDHKNAKNNAGISLIYILLMFNSSPAIALPLNPSDFFTFSGSLENMLSYNKVGETDAITTNISTLRLHGATFLWRPWLATLSSNLALSYTIRENSNSSTGQDIFGDINFNLFPQSRFPFRAFYRKSNSQIEGDFTDQNITSTAYGVSQSFITGSTGLNLDYRHMIDEDDSSFNLANNRSTRDVEDSIELSLSTTQGAHDLSVNNRFNYIERTNQIVSEDQMLHFLRHNYRPNSNLTVNNLFTYNERTLESSTGTENNLKTVQLNSNTFWRPESMQKLRIIGTALMHGSGDLGDNQIGIFDTVGLTGQAIYQTTPYLNFRGQVNVTESETNSRTFQRVGAEYTPADTEVFGSRYAYNLFGEFSNITDEIEEDRQEMNLRAGHILRHGFPTRLGLVQLSATQRGSTIADTLGKEDYTLSHSIGMGWNRNVRNISDVLQLTLSDTRRFTNQGDDSGLQQAILHISRNHRIDMNSTFTANINVQANNTLNENRDDSLNLNSSISFNYNRIHLFNVRNLRFMSELRYLSQSLFEIVNSDGFNDNNQYNVYWQNKLFYRIGLLDLRLTTSIGQTNSEFNNFILFQIRRNF